MNVTAQLEPIEESVRRAPALIRYLGEGDYVTRRYVSQGAEMNTGDYFDYACEVRDGMTIRDHFTLDTHGFVLGKHRSAIADFHDKPAVDAAYLAEVEDLVTRLSGASRTAAQGWMIRTSADLSARAKQKVEGYQHSGGIQPPAGEAHVDYNEITGQRAAARVYADRFADGPGYKRYIYIHATAAATSHLTCRTRQPSSTHILYANYITISKHTFNLINLTLIYPGVPS